MSKLMLDIGAGDSSFARLFRKLNPHLDVTVLCGEPEWRWFAGLAFWGKVKKIEAGYNAFNVPDDSLDIVTLNAYHPFMPPVGIEKELLRCLKKGGLFFSAHPVGVGPDLSGVKSDTKSLRQVSFSSTQNGKVFTHFDFRETKHLHEYVAEAVLGGPWDTVTYPASPTLVDRFRVLSGEVSYPPGALSTYVYRSVPGRPRMSVWVCE